MVRRSSRIVSKSSRICKSCPPRCTLFPSRTRSCLFYKYSSTQDGKILLAGETLREKF